MASSDLRRRVGELVALARAAGWRAELGGSGHWKFFKPSGEYVAWCAQTPKGGNRSLQNAATRLRRAGLIIPRK